MSSPIRQISVHFSFNASDGSPMPIPCTGVLLFFPPNNFGAIKQCTSLQFLPAVHCRSACPRLPAECCQCPHFQDMSSAFKVYLTFPSDSRQYPRLSHVTVLFFLLFLRSLPVLHKPRLSGTLLHFLRSGCQAVS